MFDLLNGVVLDPLGQLHIADTNTSSVYEFAAGTSGKATPLPTISGSATLLNSPVGLASDVLPRARPEPGLISRRFRGVLTLRFVPINRPPLIHAIGEAAVTKRAGG